MMKFIKYVLFFLFLFNGFSSLFAQCEKFGNYAHGAEEAKKIHFYYREYIKKKDFANAIPLWRTLYESVPAGSEYHYVDGVRIFEYLIEQTTDSVQIAHYQDTIWILYDQRLACFGKSNKKKGDILERKAFDMYKQGVDYATVYETYKAGLQLAGNNSKAFLLYPFAYLAVERFKAGEITNLEAQKVYADLSAIIAANIKTATKEVEKYQEAQENIDIVFQQELEQPIFDCAYYLKIYQPQYEANPDSLEVYREVYRALIKSGCPKTLPLLQEIYTKDSIRAVEDKAEAFAAYRDAAPKSKKAIWAYQSGDYEASINYFIDAAAEENIPLNSKAEMCFKAAQIAFTNLKDFPKSRQYAYKAIEYSPNWGKPYLLIGDLYASSGPLCGTGTGFNSQIVTWAAIDMWSKAKAVDKDPDVVGKATKQIKKYTQFMPTKEDLHNRNLKEGSSYLVPCWIQTQTTIRAYNQYGGN